MRGRVKDGGEDPVAERRQRRAMGQDAAQGIGTLRSLVDQYGDKVGANKKSWLDGLRRITSVFADQLDRPLGLIRKVDLQLSADSYSGGLIGLRSSSIFTTHLEMGGGAGPDRAGDNAGETPCPGEAPEPCSICCGTWSGYCRYCKRLRPPLCGGYAVHAADTGAARRGGSGALAGHRSCAGGVAAAGHKVEPPACRAIISPGHRPDLPAGGWGAALFTVLHREWRGIGQLGPGNEEGHGRQRHR